MKTDQPARPEYADRFLTIEEVAARMKISRSTVWRWRKQGLRQTRKGRVIRVLENDLNSFLNEQNTEV